MDLQQPPRPTEITPETALELIGLGLATMIDVRQPFELDRGGCLRCAENIPLLHFKQTLGHGLNEGEQEILDADEPDVRDVVAFIGAINRHYCATVSCSACAAAARAAATQSSCYVRSTTTAATRSPEVFRR